MVLVESGRVTLKLLEIVITLTVYISTNTIPSPSFTVWKTKGWDLIQEQIRFVCVCVYSCVFVQLPVCLRTSFSVCACVGWRSRSGNIFYKELSCQEAIVCTVRWQASNPGDGWRPADEKKKKKIEPLFSEAMSRISAGVWGQSAARNSLSIGKNICHICLAGKRRN